VERAAELLAAVEATGAGAFLADTSPIIYRLERTAPPRLVRACDALFDAVQEGKRGCIVSAVTVAELFVKPFAAGPAAVATMDAFFRDPTIGIAEIDYDIARTAARLVARLVRLPDALIAATAIQFDLPIVTGDRRLARAVSNSILVADHA